MRALKGGVPRLARDMRTADARAYAVAVRDIAARLGELPASARPWLRAYGRLAAIEIPAQERALDYALERGRAVDARRARRALATTRGQLLRVELRLEQLAADRRDPETDLARLLRGAGD